MLVSEITNYKVGLTSVGFAAGLEFLMLHHLINFLSHGLDVIDDQFIQITVGVFAARTDAKNLANRKVVLLLHFKDVDVLIYAIGNLPSNGKMIITLRGGPNDRVTGCL